LAKNPQIAQIHFGRVARPFLAFFFFENAGAPSLRFGKGGYDAAETMWCLPSASVVPALRKKREERGTPLC